MQNRYAGDIGDYGKLGLLRKLRGAGLTVGVNWYLTPDEIHNKDGLYVGYLQKAVLSDCDYSLWRQLGVLVQENKRSVAALEKLSILDARFSSEMLDLSGMTKTERAQRRWEWHCRAQERLSGCDIIFVDPDNGLIVPSQEGKGKSNKYVLPLELIEYYRGGASVIYYQHKARQKDDFYAAQHARLASSGGFADAKTLGLKFKATSLRYYFFLMQPRHARQIERCVDEMLEGPWAKCFERV